MRLESGPGPVFLLGVIALTAFVSWSAATQTAMPELPPKRLQSIKLESDKPPGAGFKVIGQERPDGRQNLKATGYGADEIDVPGLSELEGQELEYALAVLNGTVAVCEPCWVEGRSMADCLRELPEDCSLLPGLAERAVRLTVEGLTPPEVRHHVDFKDAWFPTPTLALPGAPLGGVELPCWVAVDYSSPFSRDGEAVWTALEAEFGDAVAFAWLMAPRDEEASRAAARAALVAQSRGCFEPVHAALMAAPLEALRGDHAPTEIIAEAFVAAGCGEPPKAEEGAETLAAHLALAEALGVRGTPTAFINGHRARGLRSVEAYAHILRAERGGDE